MTRERGQVGDGVKAVGRGAQAPVVSGAALDRTPAGQTSNLSGAEIAKAGPVCGDARPRLGAGKGHPSMAKGASREDTRRTFSQEKPARGMAGGRVGRRLFQRPRGHLRRRDPQDSRPSSSRSPRPPPRTRTALGPTQLLWRKALFLNTFIHAPPRAECVCQPPGEAGSWPRAASTTRSKTLSFWFKWTKAVPPRLCEFAYEIAPGDH